MSQELRISDLTETKENSYFTLMLVFSILCWLFIAITIIGIFYALLFGIMFWIGHGLLIAHLRSECVLVNEQQLPTLHKAFLEVCEQLEIREIPELYVLQSGGVLNAFATRFSGRNFVVVFSEMLEAHGEDSPRIRFILGHELGHIKRNHIFKQLLILPGTLAPLIGAAYSRACEATCDRHGAFACGDINGGIEAMMMLSGGKWAGARMSADAFARQHHAARGFFVSWHELISGYPTLSQRVMNLVALRDHVVIRRASRNPLAYLFALFSVGGRAGAGGALFTVAVIAMLMAIAIPSFVRARDQAEQAQRMQHAKPQKSVQHQ